MLGSVLIQANLVANPPSTEAIQFPTSIRSTIAPPIISSTKIVPPPIITSTVSRYAGAGCYLAIAKSMSPPSPVTIGSTVTFQFSVEDTAPGTANCGGNGLASNTYLTDTLPTGFTAISPATQVPAGWTCTVTNTATSSQVSCYTVNAFLLNQPQVIAVQATVDQNAPASTQNCAFIKSSGDWNPPNQNVNNNESCIPIHISGGTPCDLQLVKKISPLGPVASNSPATVTLTLENVGQTQCGVGVLFPITVTDTLPTGMTVAGPITQPTGWNCQPAGSTVTCNTTGPSSEIIPPNTPITITIPVTVTGNPGDVLPNCATLTSIYPHPGLGPTQLCAQITIIGTPPNPCSLSITKTATSSSVQVGQTATFLIIVTNTGTQACASNIPIATTVTDTLPPGSGFSNLSGSGTGWNCPTTTTLTVTCTTYSFFNVGQPQSSTITITATAPNTPGTYNNCADLTNTASNPQTSHTCAPITITPSGTVAPTCANIDGTHLVAWWPGEGNFNDIVGNNNGQFITDMALRTPGTPSGWTPAMVGSGAFQLNPSTTNPNSPPPGIFPSGSTQSIEVPQSPTLDPPQITVDAWVKTSVAYTVPYGGPGNPKSEIIVSEMGAAGGLLYGYQLYISAGTGTPGKLEFEIYNGAAISASGWAIGTTNILDGGWHHVAATYNGAIIQLYVDGIPDGSAPYVGGIGNSVSFGNSMNPYMEIGGTDLWGRYYFSGSIDDLEIWNRQLSQVEILQIFNAGSAGKCPNNLNSPGNILRIGAGTGTSTTTTTPPQPTPALSTNTEIAIAGAILTIVALAYFKLRKPKTPKTNETTTGGTTISSSK